jgi:pyruvate dehydrogenase (quinone)
VAAKFAYPDRVAIGLIGDGAMQMLGINALISVAKYWKRWKDPRMIILVLNNRDLNQVTWEQRIMVGDAKFATSQDVPDFAYDEYAKMLGLEGIRIEHPSEVKDALDTAMIVQRPVVLNVYTDPSVPPMPPHVSFKQAKAFASAVFHGDEDSWDMIKQSAKDVWSEYFPADNAKDPIKK